MPPTLCSCVSGEVLVPSNTRPTAILSGRLIVPASRLLTVMFLLFGLLLWLPRLLANPNDHLNWGGNAQNLALTAAAWIVADLVRRFR